jgi:hypothetical protein
MKASAAGDSGWTGRGAAAAGSSSAAAVAAAAASSPSAAPPPPIGGSPSSAAPPRPAGAATAAVGCCCCGGGGGGASARACASSTNATPSECARRSSAGSAAAAVAAARSLDRGPARCCAWRRRATSWSVSRAAVRATIADASAPASPPAAAAMVWGSAGKGGGARATLGKRGGGLKRACSLSPLRPLPPPLALCFAPERDKSTVTEGSTRGKRGGKGERRLLLRAQRRGTADREGALCCLSASTRRAARPLCLGCFRLREALMCEVRVCVAFAGGEGPSTL